MDLNGYGSFCVLFAFLVVQTKTLDFTLDSCYMDDNETGLSCYPKPLELSPDENINFICDGSKQCKGKLNDVDYLRIQDHSSISRSPSEILRQMPMLKSLMMEMMGGTHQMRMQPFTKEDLNGASHLTTLYVSEDKIPHVPANVISLAPRLTDLTLWRSEIESVENSAFSSSTLVKLSLGDNKLESLKKGMFLGAPNLEEIYLGKNTIEDIEDGTFDLPKLKSVDLTENFLKTLAYNLFANAPDLTILIIEDNELSEIVKVAQKAQKLETLSLSDNSMMKDQLLQHLPDFPNLKSLVVNNANQSLPVAIQPHELTYLSIDNTNLSDSGLLNKLKVLKQLRNLSVTNCKLTKLDNFDKIEEIFPRLKFLFADKNKWDCDWVRMNSGFCSSIDLVEGEKKIFCFGLDCYPIDTNWE